MNNFRLIALFISIFVNISGYCGLLLQHSISYSSDGDNIKNLSASKLNNYLFIGAALDSDQTLFLGQTFHMWNKSLASDEIANESTISLLELGPRLLWYIGELRINYLSFAYNPYTKGTRTLDGVDQTVSGSSMMFTYGYQVKLSKSFYLGASINYQMVSIKQIIVGTTESTATQSYTMITPMLDINFKF